MASKSNGVDTEWARAPPPKGTFWESVSKAFYNPEENSCFGRTPKRWAIVIVFYSIFYAALGVLFAVCFAGLMYTIDDKIPTWQLQKSLIGANPGVAYRPIPLYGLSLWYDVEMSNRSYVAELDHFFEPYKSDRWYQAKKGCNAEDNYGFPETPCIFVKVNKIYNWKPEFYTDSELPPDMPEELVAYINSVKSDEKNQVWISCQDEKGNSTEMEYPWGMGLPASFYPFMNTEGYLSPLVAVRVITKVNTLTTIRCRAWAKNIIHNKSFKEPSGYTRIVLYIEDQNNATGST